MKEHNLFVPILKTKTFEKLAAEACCSLFSENIIPYFEIMDELPVYSHSPSESERKKDPLARLLVRIGEKTCFCEIFHNRDLLMKPDAMGEKFEFLRSYLSDQSAYSKATASLSYFPSVIPSLVVDESMILDVDSMINFIDECHKNGHSCALRFTALRNYEQMFIFAKEHLNRTDYFIIDVGRNNFDSEEVFVEKALKSSGLQVNLILFNDHRNLKLLNPSYSVNGYDDNIEGDCSSIVIEKDYLRGFGDYCGVKNDLNVQSKGGNGHAIALLYCANQNRFYSIRSEKGNGTEGYTWVQKTAIEKRKILDPENTCLAYPIIESDKVRNFGKWNEICIVRYIDQIKKILV